MQKRAKLTAKLSEKPAEPPAAPETPPPAPRSSKARPDRADKTNVTGYFPLAVKWQLQDLATARYRRLGRKVSQQQLLAEALNDLFKKEGLPEICPTDGGES